jgi:hypothetical protein
METVRRRSHIEISINDLISRTGFRQILVVFYRQRRTGGSCDHAELYESWPCVQSLRMGRRLVILRTVLTVSTSVDPPGRFYIDAQKDPCRPPRRAVIGKFNR